MVSTPHGDVPRHIYEWRFPEKAHVKRAYPYVHHKTDKSGRLFYIDNAGMIDMKVCSDHAEISRDLGIIRRIRAAGCSTSIMPG